MNEKKQTKPKLTDAERYKRFLDMAEKLEASDKKADLDAAIAKVVRYFRPQSPRKN